MLAILNTLAAYSSYFGSGPAIVLQAAEAHLRADLAGAAAHGAKTQAWLVAELDAWRTATMLDMRLPLAGSCLFWAGLFTLLWYTPAVARLQSKRTVAELGILGAQVETCDRMVATAHAVVATVFGCMAWSFFGTGVCDLDPAKVKILRVGTAVTAGYILYDFSVILVSDVFRGLRPVAKDMVLHHLVIGTLAVYVLTFETMEPMLWFFSVNLFNEISTVFLHLCKFSAECGYKDTPMFAVLGGSLVTSFFVGRCLLISLTITLLGRSHLCGIPVNEYVAGSVYGLVGTHWMLNMYWFIKLMAMVLRKPKDSRPNTPREPEQAPLLEEPSQTSQSAAE